MIFWVPFQVTDRVVHLMRPDEDQSSTYKLLVGAVVYLASDASSFVTGEDLRVSGGMR